jgi:hypothetical protein
LAVRFHLSRANAPRAAVIAALSLKAGIDRRLRMSEHRQKNNWLMPNEAFNWFEQDRRSASASFGERADQ